MKKYHEILYILSKYWYHAKIELIYFNNYQLFISVILSAQSTDKLVNKIMLNFYQSHQNLTPQDIINLGFDNFYNLIKSIGLAKSKTKYILTSSKILIEKFNSNIPDNEHDLLSLLGIGRKSANVIMNVLFHKPTIGVDTHVERVSKRLAFVSEKATILEIEQKLLTITPPELIHNIHHYLVFHGRYLCKAKKPNCINCPVKIYCAYYTIIN